MTTSEHITAISETLLKAEADSVAIPPISSVFDRGDTDAGYAIQSTSVRTWLKAGRRIVGRKIGLTNPRVQQQFGVDQPDFGALFEDMRYASGDLVPFSRVLQPRIEAEMAFVLAADLTNPDPSADEVAAAVAWVQPALEIVGSRIKDWQITIVDTIADNASSGAFVLGSVTAAISDIDLVGASMTMQRTHDGQPTETVSAGAGADCLGSPLIAAAWLAAEMVRRGSPLRAGDVVLTGALGPMVAVQPGDHFLAMIEGLGEVQVTFGADQTTTGE